MKLRKEIEKQLEDAQKELDRIVRDVPPGSCAWRMQKRYVDALEWVLE